VALQHARIEQRERDPQQDAALAQAEQLPWKTLAITKPITPRTTASSRSAPSRIQKPATRPSTSTWDEASPARRKPPHSQRPDELGLMRPHSSHVFIASPRSAFGQSHRLTPRLCGARGRQGVVTSRAEIPRTEGRQFHLPSTCPPSRLPPECPATYAGSKSRARGHGAAGRADSPRRSSVRSLLDSLW